MASKTPLALVKEKFGEKAKLVTAIEKLAGDMASGSRARTRTKGCSRTCRNAKLLRPVHATFTEVKDKFGSRDQARAEAVLETRRSEPRTRRPSPEAGDVAGAAPLRRVPLGQEARGRRRRTGEGEGPPEGRGEAREGREGAREKREGSGEDAQGGRARPTRFAFPGSLGAAGLKA